MAARLGIVEDHTLYRQMLIALLRGVPGIAIEASASGMRDALAFALPRMDVVLLDVQLGDGDGIELARRFRVTKPGIGIVLLSAVDVMDRLLGIPQEELRGWNYLSKDAALSASVLVNSILMAATGRTALDAALLRKRVPRAHSVVASLGGRQREVLALVAEGLSNASIAERLGIAPHTVDNHLIAVYGALGLRSDKERNPRVAATLRYLGETVAVDG
ncbi:MAG: response regulator transcription factor [Microbacterium sp.]